MLKVGQVYVTEDKWYFTVIKDTKGRLVFRSNKSGSHYTFNTEQLQKGRFKLDIKRTMLNLMKENE